MSRGHNALAIHDGAYVENFSRRQSPWRLRRLLPYLDLKPSDRVADFACGNGLLMEIVAPLVACYAGVDISGEFVRLARERRDRLGISNAEFVCSGIPEFCASNQAAFSVAFAMDVAEHLPDDEWIGALRSIRGSIAPAGRFYMHTPNADFVVERMKKRGILLRQFPEHIAVRNVHRNIAMLEETGFAVRHARLIAHYNVLRLLHPLSRIPGIGRLFAARILIEAVPRPW